MLVMNLIVGSSRDGSNTLGILKLFSFMKKERKRKQNQKEKTFDFSGCQIEEKSQLGEMGILVL